MTNNPFDFTGRNALVTGCGSDKGIGFAAARLLARLGASVAITSTTAERIEARGVELRGDGPVRMGVPSDVPRSSRHALSRAWSLGVPQSPGSA